MKLRLLGNSIRLRLGQSEVQRLNAGEALIEKLEFGPGSPTFVYAIQPTSRGIEPHADFRDCRLTVSISAAQIRSWASTDAIGIRASQSIGEGAELSLLIEKDFECIENESGEPQDDAFPHPSEVCAPAR